METARPFRVNRSEGNAAEGVPRRWMDQRQVEVAGKQDERGIHEPVMEQNRVRKPETGVALAVPEQEARDREQDSEGRGHDRVQLLAGVETARPTAPVQQPAQVLGVEALEL